MASCGRFSQRGTRRWVVILAVTLTLSTSTPVWANRFEEWRIGMSLLFFVVPVAVLCALGVLIALIKRVFRSRKALLVCFVFSAIASVPVVWAGSRLEIPPPPIEACFRQALWRLWHTGHAVGTAIGIGDGLAGFRLVWPLGSVFPTPDQAEWHRQLASPHVYFRIVRNLLETAAKKWSQLA